MSSFQVKPQTTIDERDGSSIFVCTKLKGERAEDFKKVAVENGLSYSALLKQIISHCIEDSERSRSDRGSVSF